MFVIIHENPGEDTPEHRVVSVHETREGADLALEERQREKHRRVWECHARIVWTLTPVKTGECLASGEFETWGPGGSPFPLVSGSRSATEGLPQPG